MQLSGASLAEVEEIVASVGQEHYDDNLRFGNNYTNEDLSGVRRPRCKFTLQVKNSRGKGARRSWTGRRAVGACWHAHRDIMLEIFRRHPDALLRTGLATYRGVEDFMEKFPDTYHHNAGSMVAPVRFGDLCECDGTPAAVAPSIDEQLASWQAARALGVTSEQLTPNWYGPGQDGATRERIRQGRTQLTVGTNGHPGSDEPGPDAWRHVPKDAEPDDGGTIEFGTLSEAEGYTHVRTLRRSDIGACPHFIFVPEHYRDDGSCRCNDPGHVEMMEWGYRFDWPTLRWVGDDAEDDE